MGDDESDVDASCRVTARSTSDPTRSGTCPGRDVALVRCNTRFTWSKMDVKEMKYFLHDCHSANRCPANSPETFENGSCMAFPATKIINQPRRSYNSPSPPSALCATFDPESHHDFKDVRRESFHAHHRLSPCHIYHVDAESQAIWTKIKTVYLPLVALMFH